MTPYINHAKRARRITIAAVGIRQFKKMQREHRAQAAAEAFRNELMHGESSVVLDREAKVLKVAPPEAVVLVDHDTKTITVSGGTLHVETNDEASSVMTDEQCIVWLLSERPNGSALIHIAESLRDHGYDLSDTQIERRLKKLREAGKIRYDKSAKGWFVVTE